MPNFDMLLNDRKLLLRWAGAYFLMTNFFIWRLGQLPVPSGGVTDVRLYLYVALTLSAALLCALLLLIWTVQRFAPSLLAKEDH